jgi:isoquinoline 1-oxidoreductase subunit alpha
MRAAMREHAVHCSLVATAHPYILDFRRKRKEVGMATVKFILNGKPETVDVVPEMPLLWVLRDTLGLTGTKFGCGVALCGACTVHVNGQPMRSCSTPMSIVAGKKITTIEGLSADRSHPVQRAWIDEDVPQCGYCQSGQIMTAVALLEKTANPTDADIDEVMRNNMCRCGTYQAIRKAIHVAAQYHAESKKGGGHA